MSSAPKDFFVLAGGQRCGTTWLYGLLDRHPGICMAKPVRPEPKYFLQEHVSREEYVSKYFSDAGSRLCGEKSTSYYETEAAARRIAAALPGAKILFIFRNPVERALSNYRFSRDNGIETRSVEDVFLHDAPPPPSRVSTSVNPFDYLRRGFYSRFLGMYEGIFGRERIHAVNFEDAVAGDGRIEGVYDFLGVARIAPPADVRDKVNESRAETGVPSSVRARLREVYRQEIEAMSRYIDVASWKD